MNLNTKRGVILTIVIISTFIFGSIVTALPTNGTENPLAELWERLLGIEAEVEEITSNLDLLERIHDLEIRVEVMENCGCEDDNCFPEPDYDSNWVSMEGVLLILTHDLDSDNYFVNLIGKYDVVNGDSISPPITDEDNFHTWEYGGDWTYNEAFGTQKLGIWYEAYSNRIEIHRGYDDPYSDYIRVMIWKLE